MIKYNKHILENGLKLLHHEDKNTHLCTLNILYDVGAKYEDPHKTGFAHLFEHLMFGGSKNIPDYDTPVQLAGGENNAFTTNDLTNYYVTLPADNIETAFWLESDRMLELDFSEEILDVQRKVVCEEFKQRYLNQPYGDAWLKLRPLAYKVHPYRWSTIGMELSHIENATLDDVKKFFYSYYAPDNAIAVVAGNINFDDAKKYAEKWFSNIPNRKIKKNNLPEEPLQTSERREEMKADVPFDAIYKAWHICNRLDEKYPATDLITDILSGGNSGRLYNRLVKDKKIFSDLNAYVSGDIDAGLLIVEGKIMQGKTIEEAEKSIDEELKKLCNQKPEERELEKVKNKFLSAVAFSETNIADKAFNLAYAELLGDAEKINTEMELYKNVTTEKIQLVANEIFRNENCSTLQYMSAK